MKNIILKIVAFICLLSFTNNFKAQSVSLAINCPGTATAGSSISVDATYGYSNITGNITVVVNYDATKVTFCGSTSFATAPVLGGTGATSTLTYIFPATAGANQTGSIQMQFCAICPQSCFGTSNISNFSGNISAPSATSYTATSCGTNIAIVNNWIMADNFVGYNCKDNTVTFRLNIYGSTCYEINNPTITISSSVGTLLSSSAGTIVGSTISLAAPFSPPASYWTYYIYYTIQLPCTYKTGPVNTTAILNGENCGVNTPNLQTASASFNVAPQNASGTVTCSTTSSTYSVYISNNGSVPISANLSSLLPNLNYSGFTHYTSQTSPTLNFTYTTYDCYTTFAPAVSLTSSTTPNTESIGSSISKMDYNILNLQPGEYFYLTFNYTSAPPTCSPVATLPYSFNTSGTYSSPPDPSACNCTFLDQNFIVSTCNYNPTPIIYCGGNTFDTSVCHKAGDVLHFCISLTNYGDTALLNGFLNLGLPTYLNINTSSVTYDGSSTSATTTGIVTLPTSIAGDYVIHTVCFDATLNSLAINGLHSLFPKIYGSNYYSATSPAVLCEYKVLICQDAKAEISKLVKGSEDGGVFSTSGSGMPGTNATYRITVTNSGNTPISSIEVVDRLPEPGDNFIRGCSTPRLSAFSVLPNGIFPAVPAYTPLLPTAITYDNSSPASVNKVPSTWLPFLPSYTCDLPGSFTSLPLQNTVHVNIPSPILPFSDYTFDMQVVIPATAKPGEQICNSVALKTKYMDDSGLEHDLEIIESDKVCLTIAPPPCKPCPEMVKSETLTINPGTTTSATQPYVVKTGFVTITTLKPVQEIHINVSDLQYHFNKPECTNCKTPALSRGGIFPLTTTQTVGTLDWYDYTGSSIPTTTPIYNLPEELVWKLGVMLAPGTYTIPFQLTLPKSIIPDCCELIVDKFALKVSVKDVDCNLCESFLQPSTDNCCTGSEWASKQMTWSNIIFDRADSINKKSGQSKKQQNDYNEAVENNKLIKSGIIIANPLPLFGVLDVSCGETYHIMEGSNRTFNGVFKCNPNMKNCISESLVTITTISGNYINVVNQPMPFNQIFNLPGVFTIKFTGKCNGTVCNECEYKLIVDKNCCAGIVKKTPTTVTANHIFGSNTTTTLTFPPIPHYTAYSTAMVHIDYSCVQGCSSSYTWVRKRAGVVIASGSSSSSNINFAPPSSGEDLIQITAQCGTQNCYKTEQFYIGCEFCTIVGSGHHGGM